MLVGAGKGERACVTIDVLFCVFGALRDTNALCDSERSDMAEVYEMRRWSGVQCLAGLKWRFEGAGEAGAYGDVDGRRRGCE